ncbi:MAG: hypothetical protein HYT71_01370 [Candidatus Aenigmarchaeota archaeon]|nr:hypothetical protein [Candidatus Aenigmarchaeota archaeon]
MADLLSYFSIIFFDWLNLFTAPFAKGDSDVLWIIVPIYLSWLLAEYYQEKAGTSIGNAISNGFIGLWVGIDWARRLAGEFALTAVFAGKASITVSMFIYGSLVIYNGMKGRKLAMLIGRVKEVSYLMIVFSPIVYGLVPLTFDTIIGIVLFFPLVYGITGIADKILPSPPEEAKPALKNETQPNTEKQ